MNTPNMEYPNLALVRQGIDYRFTVKIRGAPFLMRPLSIMEEDQIDQEIIDHMKSLDPENRTSFKKSAMMSVKKLVKANTSDVGMTDQKINEIELQRFSVGEIETMFKQYTAGCDKLNPTIEQFTKDQLTEWVEGLKKNSKDLEMILIELSFFQLVALCQHLLITGESPEAK